MDDRTLIICATTLCVLGVSLTQTLGSNAAGRTADQPALATAPSSLIAGLDRHDQNAARMPRPAAAAY